LVGAAPSPVQSRAGKPTRRYLVAAIGDSLTDPRSGGGKYLSELARRCPESRFDSHGVGGQRTDHMRWRFAHDVLGQGSRRPARRYSHVIVLGGINDVLSASVRQAPIARTQRNLQTMYRLGRTHGLGVIAVTLPPWGKLEGVSDARAEATDALNRWIVERAEQGEVDFAVDIRPALTCGDERELCRAKRRFPSDLVHWNDAGHRAVAELLHRQVFADCR
jgi:lysophospholipase L1-like esterase